MNQRERATSYLFAEEAEEAGWIVTFADMITLILVFFILMFSISSMNLEKFMNVMKSIQQNLGETNPLVEEMMIGRESSEESSDKEMVSDLMQSIKEKKMGDHIVVRTDGEVIYITIEGAALFASGSADLYPGSYPILDEIAYIINRNPRFNINIKGHTDDRPISTERFHSNWELSAIRATTVLQYLIKRGIDPARLTATGYGDLIPLAPNDSEENRALNRRVEFVLEKKEK